MPTITLKTKIKSKIEIVFDLSRSVDLHQISTIETNEEAISGKTSGLMELNDFVTWRAKHFFIYQKLTSKITAFNYPHSFTDEMVDGAFKSFKHDHIFESKENYVIMTDIFDYKSPFNLFGYIADNLFLQKYMTKLLIKRNTVIQQFAETNMWQNVL